MEITVVQQGNGNKLILESKDDKVIEIIIKDSEFGFSVDLTEDQVEDLKAGLELMRKLRR
jgi:hypothetical protein